MRVKDPVCHMDIDSAKAQAQEVYRGQTYFFCSDQCHRQFTTVPERYAAQVPADKPAGKGRGDCS